MTRAASFHRLAESEFLEAAEYFERESPGLGGAFIDAVEICVTEIVEFPEAGAALAAGVRRKHASPTACCIRSGRITSVSWP